MARYRKIDIRMWGDREVLRLSRPQPNGQSLWVYLLAGPATGIVPGAYRVREGGLADELGWSIHAFREAFREVNGEAYRHGLPHGAEKPLAKADWDAGMVWVPKGIKHNPPQSINVVSSWRDAWDELPECELKREAYYGLRAFVEGMSKGFLKAFDEAIPKPSWKPSPKPYRIQEQEQEQDQEGGTRAIPVPRAPGAGSSAAPSSAPTPTIEGSQKLTQTGPSELESLSARKLWALWLELSGGELGSSPTKAQKTALEAAWSKLKSRVPSEPENFWRRMVQAYVAEKRARDQRLDLGFLCADFDSWAEFVARAATSNGARAELQDFDFGEEA